MPRCLVVDDSLLMCRTVEGLLRGWADAVTITKSPKDSLATASRVSNLDVIITDLLMPEMNGLELAVELQKIPRMNDTGETKSPTMILMTAVLKNNSVSHHLGLLRAAQQSGLFADIIHKPIQRQDFLPRIEKAIERHRSGAVALN